MLNFIRSFVHDEQRFPAVREIQVCCGISSTSVVSYNLMLLARAGLVVWPPPDGAGHGRLVVGPDDACPFCGRSS